MWYSKGCALRIVSHVFNEKHLHDKLDIVNLSIIFTFESMREFGLKYCKLVYVSYLMKFKNDH